MKNSKKGISLIVLVITIIVIIILAAAVLLSLNNNNPIDNAKQATFDSDVGMVKDAINMYISNFMAKNPVHDGPFNPETANDWIYVGSGGSDTDASYPEVGTDPEAAANGDTVYSDVVTWAKLGIAKKPASIKAMAFNCETGAVFAIPAQNSVTFYYAEGTSDADKTITNAITGLDDSAIKPALTFYTVN